MSDFNVSFNKPALDKVFGAVPMKDFKGLRVRVQDGRLYMKPVGRPKGVGIAPIEARKSGGLLAMVRGRLAEHIHSTVKLPQHLDLGTAKYGWIELKAFPGEAPRLAPQARVWPKDGDLKVKSTSGSQERRQRSSSRTATSSEMPTIEAVVSRLVLAYLKDHPDLLDEAAKPRRRARQTTRRARSASRRRAKVQAPTQTTEEAQSQSAKPKARRMRKTAEERAAANSAPKRGRGRRRKDAQAQAPSDQAQPHVPNDDEVMQESTETETENHDSVEEKEAATA